MMVFTLLFLLVTATLADVADVTDVSFIYVSACIGESKILYCKQHGVNYPKTLIRFTNSTTKKTKVVRQNNGKYDFKQNGALTIHNIQESDAGLYRYSCKYNERCWNDSSHAVCNIKLETRNCEMKRIPYGSMVMMVFKTNLPNTDIKKVVWTKKTVKPKSSVQVAMNDSITEEAKKMYSGRLQAVGTTLRITYTKRSDAGLYICLIEFVQRQNDYQKPRSSYTFHLFIEGSPPNVTNATVMPLEPVEGPTARNVSSLTKYVPSTVPSSTVASTTKEDNARESIILAGKSLGTRVQATDCMYMISSALMMTYFCYKPLIFSQY